MKLPTAVVVADCNPYAPNRLWNGHSNVKKLISLRGGVCGGGNATNLRISNTSLIPRAEESQNFIQESAFLGGLTWVLQSTGQGSCGQGLLGNLVLRMDNQLRQFVGRLHGCWADSKGRQHLELVLGPAEANSERQNNQ